jgi:hypothetical protein
MRIVLLPGVILIASVLILGKGMSGQPGSPSKPLPRVPTWEQIEQVWQKRQNQIGSARFHLRLERTLYRGAITSLQAARAQAIGSADAGGEQPPQDQFLSGEATISWRGSQIRYEYAIPEWDPIGKRLYSARRQDVFDGQLNKSLMQPASGQVSYPLGEIRPSRQSLAVSQFALLPLWITFRAGPEGVYPDLKQAVIRERLVPIRNRWAVEVALGDKKGLRQEILYLDAERDYILLRQIVLREQQPSWQIEVRYQQDARVGWVPRSWEYLILEREKQPLVAERYEVVQYALNPSLDDKEFELIFPPGTRVIDSRSGMEMQYVIRENGQPGLTVPGTDNPTYEDLQKRPVEKHGFLLIVLVAVLVMGLTGMGLLRWFQRRQQQER